MGGCFKQQYPNRYADNLTHCIIYSVIQAEMSDKFAKDNNMEKPKETIKWWEPIESKEG